MLATLQNDFSTAINKIYSIDLYQVMERLVNIDKWKLEEALIGCKQYRNFLVLKLKYGDQYSLPPSRDIDDVWHAHILHTEEYMNFCNEVFSKYLHHHPHQGKNHSITIKQLINTFNKQTQKLYFKEFGEYITNIRSEPANDNLLQLNNKKNHLKSKKGAKF